MESSVLIAMKWDIRLGIAQRTQIRALEEEEMGIEGKDIIVSTRLKIGTSNSMIEKDYMREGEGVVYRLGEEGAVPTQVQEDTLQRGEAEA